MTPTFWPFGNRPRRSGPTDAKHRLNILPRYGSLGASSRVRMYAFLDILGPAGLRASVFPLFSDEYVRQLYGPGRSVSLVVAAYARRFVELVGMDASPLWIEKECLPFLPAWLELLLIRGRPFAVEYDDAIFHAYDSSERRFVRVFLGDKIDRLMRAAEVVIVGNRYLEARAKAAGARRVVVIPTVVDHRRYAVRTRKGADALEVPIIGWIGSPATQQYVRALLPSLSKLAREGLSFKLRVIGARPFDLEGVPGEFIEWSEAYEERALCELDVGIMPLPDGPSERGKCGYKIVQYMAAGVAAVASPVGANRDIVEDGVTGLLASSPEEWEAALRRLIARPDLRDAMGLAGRIRAVERYSRDAVRSGLLHELLGLIDGTTLT